MHPEKQLTWTTIAETPGLYSPNTTRLTHFIIIDIAVNIRRNDSTDGDGNNSERVCSQYRIAKLLQPIKPSAVRAEWQSDRPLTV